MSMRLWRIEELEELLEKTHGCAPVSGWDSRFAGRWWKLPTGRWFLVPYPEEASETGERADPTKCRYPGFVVDGLFRAIGLPPPP